MLILKVVIDIKEFELDPSDKENFTYWFVRVKEVGSDITYGEQVEDHVFRLMLGSREKAKEYCINKYGNLPFRKPKEAPTGTRYLYLMPSDEYWYNREYQEFNVICEFCGKHYIQIGDTYKSKLFNVNGKSICSVECNLGYKQKLQDEYNSMSNNNYWVSENAHPLTDPNYELAGYIYKITNKKLMVSYIGKTIKPPIFRWWQHLAVDDKFLQSDLSDLVFEVVEIIYYNRNNDWDVINYGSAEEKLNQMERHYIDYFDTKNNGFNKI